MILLLESQSSLFEFQCPITYNLSLLCHRRHGPPLVIQPNMAQDTGGLGVSFMLSSVSSHVNLITEIFQRSSISRKKAYRIFKNLFHPSMIKHHYFIQFRNFLITSSK